MEIDSLLTEIRGLPIEDRLRLMERIWDDILEPTGTPVLNDDQRAELQRRLEEDDADPDNVIPWETAMRNALGRALDEP